MKRFLVVEDEGMSRLMLSEFLAEYALCDVAENGKEGLRLFEQSLSSGEPYHLICIDLVMPEMNGLALIRKIKELEKSHHLTSEYCAKIFVITSSDSTWDRADLLLENLCDDYIVKPFDRVALLASLRSNGLA
jgi:two-component system chemotaxis response regulator CheY